MSRLAPGRMGIGAPLPYGRYGVGAGIGQIMNRGRARRYGVGASLAGDPCGINPVCPPTTPICPQGERRYFLSFAQNAVAAGATVTLTARPQYVFRADQFVIPSTLAAFFDVVTLNIGVAPQFAAVGVTSGVVFSEVSVNNQMVFDTAQPGIEISLQVTNTDANPQNFRATLIGLTVN